VSPPSGAAPSASGPASAPSEPPAAFPPPDSRLTNLLLLTLAALSLGAGALANFLALAGVPTERWPFPVGIPFPDLTLATGLVSGCCLLLLLAGVLRFQLPRAQLAFVVALTGILVVLPLLAHVAIRHRTGNLRFTHDGGVTYIEAAIDHLVAGRNPYAASYAGTIVEQKFASDPGWSQWNFRPILEFLPYLPLPVLLGLPLRLGIEPLLGFYDQRFLYLLLLGLSFLFLARLFPAPDRPLGLALVFLNPLLIIYLIQGTIDIVLIFWMILGAYFLARSRVAAASICFGLAAVSKQFAWFLWPFLLALWLPSGGSRGYRLRVLVRRVLPGAVAALLVILPFLLWSPRDFIEDVLLFNFGVLGTFYPFGGTPGYGFANILLATGVVPSVRDSFPLLPIQLLITLPVIGIGLLRVHRSGRAAEVFRFAAASLFAFLYFSRMFHFSYFGVLLVFLVLARGLDRAAAVTGGAGDPRSRRW
jgi:hypothetical protein